MRSIKGRTASVLLLPATSSQKRCSGTQQSLSKNLVKSQLDVRAVGGGFCSSEVWGEEVCDFSI